MDIGLRDTGPINNILNVKIPERIKYRIRSFSQFDYVFGGEDDPGLVPGTIVYFTGKSGGGKTTMVQQYLDQLEQTYKNYNGIITYGAKTLLNSTEQTIEDTAIRIQNLDGINCGFAFSTFKSTTELFDYCEQFIQPIPEDEDQALVFLPKNDFVLVIDSLQSMKDSKGETDPISVLEEVISWAKKNFVCVILLGHVKRDGEFTGLNKIIHMIDMHMHITVVEDVRKKQTYYIEMLKNRKGPINIKFWYENGKRGVKFLKSIEEEND
jgi:predicted ATP-dependent serine protease